MISLWVLKWTRGGAKVHVTSLVGLLLSVIYLVRERFFIVLAGEAS